MKTQKKQANFRLPEPLLSELKTVAERGDIPQAKIVETAVREKLAQLRNEAKPLALN